jgi:hypothetical protein
MMLGGLRDVARGEREINWIKKSKSFPTAEAILRNCYANYSDIARI